jgi:hypothetical protein
MTKQCPTVLPVDLSGSGPFLLPLLIRLDLLSWAESRGHVIADFLSQHEQRILATIARPALQQLVAGDRSEPLEAHTLPPARPLELLKPGGAYELPKFSSFDGHMQRGPNRRTLVLSTEHGSKVWLPLGVLTYHRLLTLAEDCLLRHEDRRHA